MQKKYYAIIVLLLVALVGAGFYFFHGKKVVSLVSDKSETGSEVVNVEASIEASIEDSKTQRLFVSGWIPYWAKQKGADSLKNNLSLFSEINPFAFEVDSNGIIQDKMSINSSPWPELRKEAEKNNVSFVPTILWADAKAMHKIFSDKNLLQNHVDSIKIILDKNNFSGVDIDYEGKDVADKDLFSNFLKNLHETLSSEGKSVECTIEARTEDNVPEGWSGTRAMSFANDYSALNEFCDNVKIMAYDEVFQVNGQHQTFEDKSAMPSAPNADIQWVEKVIQYASKYIAPEKIILGVPTYGWEFKFEKIPTGYSYSRIQSVSYSQAIAEAKSDGVTPMRNSGGELSFIFNQNRIVTFSDSVAIGQKIDLVKKFDLKGINLFKIDGLFDPGIYSVFERAEK